MSIPSAIRITAFHKEIRQSSSLPIVVTGSDGHRYVSKLHGSGDGVLASVVEYLALKIGRLLDIPVLDPELLILNADQVEKNIDPEISELMERSIGFNIGTRYLENAVGYQAQPVNPILKRNIFLFDLFLMNIDRTVINPNMIISGRDLYVLDFSSSVAIRNCVEKTNYDETPLLHEMKRHLFYETNINADLFIEAIQSISNSQLSKITDALPDSWLTSIRSGLTSKEKRMGIYEELIRKKNCAGLMRAQLDMMHEIKIESDETRKERRLTNKKEFLRKHNLVRS